MAAGLLLGTAFASCDSGPSATECYGVCGSGTECVDQKCVIAAAEPEPEPEPEPPRKKRGRRSKRGRRGSKAHADADASPGFTPEDDSHVPEYNAKKTKNLDLNAGSERLSDRIVNQHLSRIEPALNRCVEKAAAASDDPIGPGSIALTLSIAGTGKVSSVSAKASPKLRVFGIVPCVRRAVHAHKFPSFDGPTMGVDYSFKVD